MTRRHTYPVPFQDLDHTADLGVLVEGATPEEVLARLVLAFSEQLTGGGPLGGEVREDSLRVAPGDRASMAVDVLRELLFRFDRERLIPKSCVIERFDEALGTELSLGFARYDEALHAEGTELKAVTLHEARVEHDGHGWRGQIVFDV